MHSARQIKWSVASNERWVVVNAHLRMLLPTSPPLNSAIALVVCFVMVFFFFFTLAVPHSSPSVFYELLVTDVL